MTKPADGSTSAVTKTYTLIVMYPCRELTVVRKAKALSDMDEWKTVDYDQMNSPTYTTGR